MKLLLLKLFKIVGVIALIIVVFNFQFFWQNLVYTFQEKPTVQNHTGPSNQFLSPNTLKIESLGIEAPVVYVEENSEKVFQEALERGVVHYPGTALPGQPGNVYIFGHSSDYVWSKGGYRTVFALLPRIKIGAEVILSDQQGLAYTYIVRQSMAVAADDVHYLDQGNYEKKLLTLQTSYPIGTALRRWIVICELKS